MTFTALNDVLLVSTPDCILLGYRHRLLLLLWYSTFTINRSALFIIQIQPVHGAHMSYTGGFYSGRFSNPILVL